MEAIVILPDGQLHQLSSPVHHPRSFLYLGLISKPEAQDTTWMGLSSTVLKASETSVSSCAKGVIKT